MRKRALPGVLGLSASIARRLGNDILTHPRGWWPQTQPLLGDYSGSISTHLAEIEDWLISAPVRKRRTKSGLGALRLAGLP